MKKQIRIQSLDQKRDKVFCPKCSIESKRFSKSSYPHVDSLIANNNLYIAISVEKKLEIHKISNDFKSKIETQKFKATNTISCISLTYSDNLKAIIITVKSEVFLIDGDSIIFVGHFPFECINIFDSDIGLRCVGGTMAGGITSINLDDKKYFQMPTEIGSGINHILLSNSRESFVCSFFNGCVGLYTTDSLECTWCNSFSFGSILALSWSPNDNYFAFASQNDNFYVLNTLNPNNMKCCTGHNSFVNSISFLSCNEEEFTIISSADDSQIGIWNFKDSSEDEKMKSKFIPSPETTTIRYLHCLDRKIILVDSNSKIAFWKECEMKKVKQG